MSLDKINDIAREVHANAVEKGWWDADKPRSARATRALIASELTGEALEEFRERRMDLWFSCEALSLRRMTKETHPELFVDPSKTVEEIQFKPEGFGIELADGLIRMLDWNAAREEFFGAAEIELMKARHPMPVPFDVITVPDQLDWAAEQLYRTGMWRDFVMAVMSVADANGVDLWECVRIKMAYNRTRPHRHGGKAA